MNSQREILIVDDEEKIVEALSAYLIQNGYGVCAAHNGRDAVQLFESRNVSLVILDLMLPDMTGEEICAWLRARSRVPIIMLTAKVSEASLRTAWRSGRTTISRSRSARVA